MRALGHAGVGDVLGVRPLLLLGLDNSAVVTGSDDLLARLKARSDIQSIEPDKKASAYLTPDDPELPNQHGLIGTFGIGAPAAWDLTTGSSGVVVGVVDTGTDYTHPDLSAAMWTNAGEIPGNGADDDGNGYVDDYHGYDFNGLDGDPMDDNVHGTHVSGTVGAVGNNGTGVTGVAFTSSIMSIKVLDQDGSGYMSAIAAGIEYAIEQKDRGVNLVALNMSLGGSDYTEVLYRAVERAATRGILVIAAAGNEGANNNVSGSYPANFKLANMISVAATTADGLLASFSNFGSTSVHLAAPGARIKSTVPLFYAEEPYALLSGTSMATPHVSGVVALIASINPSLTASQIRSIVFETVQPLSSLKGKTVTGGLLNAGSAVGRAVQTAPAYALFGYVLKRAKGVRGVRVRISSSDRQLKESTKTAVDGSYRFDDLPAGLYTVTAQKGATRFRKRNFLVTVQSNQRQNFEIRRSGRPVGKAGR